MKRIHLFEFEDLSWFPNSIREAMTRLIIVMHRLLQTSDKLSGLLARLLKETGETTIVDYCSGGGGPMLEVYEKLQTEHGLKNIKLSLTDLYPNQKAAKAINDAHDGINYITAPTDVTKSNTDLKGVRTMVSSFHHMKPEVAKNILRSAQESKHPICIYEISDNKPPIFLWWIAVPINIISCLFITLASRPITLGQLFFTYIIPIIPLAFAWDGAISNARTYTLEDLDILLEGLESNDYTWEKGAIKGRGTALYLIGKPKA